MKKVLLFAMSLFIITVPCLFAQNIVANGEFDDGETGWEGWINNGEVTVDVAIDTTGKLSGQNSYRMSIANASDVTYYIQRCIDVPIELGHSYQVSFTAVATDAAGDSSEINVLFEENGGDYAKRLNEIAVVTSTPEVFTYTIDYCPATDATNQLKLHFGGTVNTGDTIWVDAIEVTDLGVSMDIVVDGYCDPFFQTLTGPDDGYLQLKSYAFNNNGIPEGDADLSAKIWTAWDEEWLYIYEEVKDDTIAMSSTNTYNNDGFEMKVDPIPTDSTQTSTVAFEMTALYDTTETGATKSGYSNITLADSLKQFARRLTDDGYVLEMAVKWSALSSSTEIIVPEAGTIFGAALQNHDNDNTTGKRDASVQWAAVLTDNVWNTPKYLGTVTLLEDKKLQFVPTNNMTGTTNTIPYDGTPFFLQIDGKKDPFYSELTGPDDGYLQLRSYAYNNNGAPDDDADLSAKIWTAWDENYFYLYEEVKDDTISMSSTHSYNNDGFEMKIDPVATDSVTNSVWSLEMTAVYTDTAEVEGEASLADSLMQWSRTITSDGYIIEFAMKWEAIAQAGETVDVGVGNVFGAALQNHDNDNALGNRNASVQWAAILTDAVWNTPKDLGTVKFLDDHKLQYVPSNNMTGKTNTIPYDGTDYDSAVDEKDVPGAKMTFNLAQNYPNPFNPTTMISYSVPATAEIRLSVFDVLGREVSTLVNQRQSAGTYNVTFDGKALSSGVYFYRLQAGDKVKIQKMMLIK